MTACRTPQPPQPQAPGGPSPPNQSPPLCPAQARDLLAPPVDPRFQIRSSVLNSEYRCWGAQGGPKEPTLGKEDGHRQGFWVNHLQDRQTNPLICGVSARQGRGLGVGTALAKGRGRGKVTDRGAHPDGTAGGQGRPSRKPPSATLQAPKQMAGCPLPCAPASQLCQGRTRCLRTDGVFPIQLVGDKQCETPAVPYLLVPPGEAGPKRGFSSSRQDPGGSDSREGEVWPASRNPPPFLIYESRGQCV